MTAKTIRVAGQNEKKNPPPRIRKTLRRIPRKRTRDGKVVVPGSSLVHRCSFRAWSPWFVVSSGPGAILLFRSQKSGDHKSAGKDSDSGGGSDSERIPVRQGSGYQ